MNLLPLAKRLESMRLGKQGVDIFVHVLPDTSHDAILLRTPLPTAVNAELPGYYKARFQVIVRSIDAAAGVARVETVIDALTLGEITVGPQTFKRCGPLFLPLTYPIDSGAYFEHVVGMEAIYVEA